MVELAIPGGGPFDQFLSNYTFEQEEANFCDVNLQSGSNGATQPRCWTVKLMLPTIPAEPSDLAVSRTGASIKISWLILKSYMEKEHGRAENPPRCPCVNIYNKLIGNWLIFKQIPDSNFIQE
jgi:hypothetical protein